MSPSLSADARASGPATSPAEAAVGLVVLASAGGVTALGVVLASLPAAFRTPVPVVEHLQPDRPSALRAILERRTALRIREARDGDALEPGTVYVAPPDAHLLVHGSAIRLDRSPPVRDLRPRADLLLRSLLPQAAETVVVGGAAATVLPLEEIGGAVLAAAARGAAG